jgi:putative glutamine amidotransferase
MTRPLILVTCWRRRLPTFLGARTILETLDPAYADRISHAGGQPLLVSRPPSRSDETACELIELADGLLLTGGGDVDPASYGAARDNVEGDDLEADRFELALIAAAEAARLPTLAICRGAQLLAVAHGGRLAQRPAPRGEHGELTDLTAEQIRAARHPVSLADGSRLRRAFGRATIAVNTIHHHQIADAGDLIVTALAPGGVIEAAEPRADWACVGVQWHPEKMAEPEQCVLFERLVEDARTPATELAL